MFKLLLLSLLNITNNFGCFHQREIVPAENKIISFSLTVDTWNMGRSSTKMESNCADIQYLSTDTPDIPQNLL